MNDTGMNEFLAACAAPERLRLTVEISGGQIECALEQPFAVIGRDPRADIHIPDERLRSRHVFLQFINGRLVYLDLNQEVPPFRAGWLDPGQRVEFGHFAIRIPENTRSPDSGATVESELAHRETLTQILFDVSSRNISTTWRMKRPIALVGRSPICRIRLAGEQVSRIHCALVNTQRGLWAVDLKSTNGIAINGSPAAFGVLPEGSELQVCKFLISPRPLVKSAPNPDMLPIRVLTTPGKLEGLGVERPVGGESQHQDGEFFPSPLTIASPELQSRAADSDLAPVVLQLSRLQQHAFAQMQKLMAEQFQQSMSMFVDAFWAMQQEQSKQVRRELRQIRRMTRELSSLHGQLAELKSTNPGLAARSTEIIAPPRVLEATAPPVAKPTEQKTKGPIDKPQPASAPAPAPPPSSRPIRNSPADMHAWLNCRVAEIQQKRLSSWQRLMGLLQGKSVPESGPTPSTAAPGKEV